MQSRRHALWLQSIRLYRHGRSTRFGSLTPILHSSSNYRLFTSGSGVNLCTSENARIRCDYWYLVRFIDHIQSDEVRYYRSEANKCAMRAQAAKRDKDALQGEKGNLQAQLNHQVKFPKQEDIAAELVTFRGLEAFFSFGSRRALARIAFLQYLSP